MRIWIDGDACPAAIKELLYRAAERVKVPLVLVANVPLRPPPSKYISTIRVAAGPDVADKEIARRCAKGDLVITADIPLAAEVVARGAFALNPRGELYTEATVRERLSMRNFMDDLRAGGIDTGGPAALNRKDRQNFANNLDRFLTQWYNTGNSSD
ncbi:MAG: YaiI/YqxD family protein [Desulfobulbus sp.]|nr:MAG: YaiI/YqxD family protein [Desulfobulbus sp.]